MKSISICCSKCSKIINIYIVTLFLISLWIDIQVVHSVGTHLLHAGPSCFIQPKNLIFGLSSPRTELKHRGVCYSTLLCKQKGGVAIGKCGLGNSCCVFPQTCNSISVRNSTYFTNPDYPESTPLAQQEPQHQEQQQQQQQQESSTNTVLETLSQAPCSLTIHRMPGIHPICRFRLDFIEYDIEGHHHHNHRHQHQHQHQHYHQHHNEANNVTVTTSTTATIVDSSNSIKRKRSDNDELDNNDVDTSSSSSSSKLLSLNRIDIASSPSSSNSVNLLSSSSSSSSSSSLLPTAANTADDTTRDDCADSDRITLRAMHSGEDIVPPICPRKLGQHVMIDVRQHIGPFILTVNPITPGGGGSSGGRNPRASSSFSSSSSSSSPPPHDHRRRWNILINQIECTRSFLGNGGNYANLVKRNSNS